MEALGSAVLTEDIAADRAVEAVVSREEIAGALDEEAREAELVLQIVRPDEDGQDTISIVWTREELEKLLARATNDRVVLTFDREQLSQALADVEAHGLRERALVFAVAATAALGTGAGIASAMPDGDMGTTASAAVSQTLTDVSSTGGYAAAAAADSQLTDVSSGAGYAAPVEASESGAMLTDASSGAGYAAPEASETGSSLTDVSSGAGYAAPVEASAGGSTLTDASSGGGYTAPAVEPASGGGGLSFDAPSPTDGAIAGGIALAIAAAAFSARRSRPVRPS